MASSLAAPVKEAAAKTKQVSVVLVVPPFASAACPALGPSLLTAGCRANQISATVFYANLDFAAAIGFSLYQKINHSYSEDLIGEAVFRTSAFESKNSDKSKIIEELFDGKDFTRCREDQIPKEEMLKCLKEVDSFLDRCVEEILAMDPKIVGFSSVFQQTLASIALAKRIKEKRPEVLTVLGGANASNPMGNAISKTTDVFDYIFSGESDFEFPQFCENYLKEEKLPEKNMVECSSIYEMDQTETPNYEDYFKQLKVYQEQNTLPQELPLWLHFETSRGCWWGAKSHCTFCGLNALEMNYRRKSKERIMKDFESLSTYGIKRLHAVDNIMPYEFHRDVLPALAEKDEKFELFYEVKSNLKVRDLDMLAAAGVSTLQPGIESLSSNVLKQMGKGVTGIQNISLLRNSVSRGINIVWNFMIGLPGETKADYEEIIKILPYVEHLQAPDGMGPVRLDRYSPYHSFPDKYGIKNVQPFRGYFRLFPEDTNFHDIAYYFIGEYTTEFLHDPDLRVQFEAGIEHWKSVWENSKARPKLCASSFGEEIQLIEDTRRCAKGRYYIATAETAKLLNQLSLPTPRKKITEKQQPFLQELLKRHFVIEHENQYLSVVSEASSLPSSTKWLAGFMFLLALISVAILAYFFFFYKS